MERPRYKVAVLGGGPSAEHEVSLQTAAFVLEQLRGRGHAAHPLRLDRHDGWILGGPDETLDALAGRTGESEAALLPRLRKEGFTVYVGLHGPFGEDGQVQRRLEAAGLPYTGSGPAASEVGMDKELSKVAATRLGARTASHELIEPGQKAPRNALGRSLGYPCVVKPLGAGSSVGVSLVPDADALEPALARARAEDPRGRVLAEEYVRGVEVASSVFRRDGELVVLPPVSVHPARPFYDYQAKYVSDETRYVCPAELTAEQRADLEQLATALYTALEMRGVVRVDGIVPEAGGRPVFLELNTLPGFTRHSLVPLAARTAGLDPGELLEAVLADTGPA